MRAVIVFASRRDRIIGLSIVMRKHTLGDASISHRCVFFFFFLHRRVRWMHSAHTTSQYRSTRDPRCSYGYTLELIIPIFRSGESSKGENRVIAALGEDQRSWRLLGNTRAYLGGLNFYYSKTYKIYCETKKMLLINFLIIIGPQRFIHFIRYQYTVKNSYFCCCCQKSNARLNENNQAF